MVALLNVSWWDGSYGMNLKIEEVISSPVPVGHQRIRIGSASAIEEAPAWNAFKNNVSIFAGLHDAPLQVLVVSWGSIGHQGHLSRFATAIQVAVGWKALNGVELPTWLDHPLKISMLIWISVAQQHIGAIILPAIKPAIAAAAVNGDWPINQVVTHQYTI